MGQRASPPQTAPPAPSKPPASPPKADPRLRICALNRLQVRQHGGAPRLNEDALRAAAARAAAQDEARGERAVRLSAVELADLPFTQQLPLFRSAAILTGMHGAGCAPPATPPRGACTPRQLPHCLLLPPGRCEPDLPDSWVGGRRAVPARLLHQLVRAHLAPARSPTCAGRTASANARKNFDTVVDEAQFLALMKRASQLWRGIEELSYTV